MYMPYIGSANASPCTPNSAGSEGHLKKNGTNSRKTNSIILFFIVKVEAKVGDVASLQISYNVSVMKV